MATNINLQNFVINSVESKEVWDYMVGNGLVNENELYIVHGYTAATIRSATVSIVSSQWTGGSGLYSQIVFINTVTPNTKVDLQPTAQQIKAMQEAGISLMAENNNGVVTVYGIGGIPMEDFTFQALLTEVEFV